VLTVCHSGDKLKYLVTCNLYFVSDSALDCNVTFHLMLHTCDCMASTPVITYSSSGTIHSFTCQSHLRSVPSCYHFSVLLQPCHVHFPTVRRLLQEPVIVGSYSTVQVTLLIRTLTTGSCQYSILLLLKSGVNPLGRHCHHHYSDNDTVHSYVLRRNGVWC